MGYLERFIGRQRRRNEEGESSASNINRLGMTVLSDEKLISRISVYDEMLKLVQDSRAAPHMALDEIERRVHEINNILNQVAVPFGRAGDRYYYAEAMRGWSTLQTKMMDMVHAAKTLDAKWKGSEAERRELAGKVFHFYTSVYLRYALLIAAISWYGEDVSPSWSAVIMQPTPVERPRPTSFQMPRDLNEEAGREER